MKRPGGNHSRFSPNGKKHHVEGTNSPNIKSKDLTLDSPYTPRKEEEEIEFPDGRKVKVKISPPLDFDYPWNRGKHWFFRSPYRGMSPFAFFLVIVAVSTKYGWALVGAIWVFVLIMGGIGIIISLIKSR